MNLVQRRRSASKATAQQREAEEETRRQIALAVSIAVREALEALEATSYERSQKPTVR